MTDSLHKELYNTIFNVILAEKSKVKDPIYTVEYYFTIEKINFTYLLSYDTEKLNTILENCIYEYKDALCLVVNHIGSMSVYDIQNLDIDDLAKDFDNTINTDSIKHKHVIRLCFNLFSNIECHLDEIQNLADDVIQTRHDLDNTIEDIENIIYDEF